MNRIQSVQYFLTLNKSNRNNFIFSIYFDARVKNYYFFNCRNLLLPEIGNADIFRAPYSRGSKVLNTACPKQYILWLFAMLRPRVNGTVRTFRTWQLIQQFYILTLELESECLH